MEFYTSSSIINTGQTIGLQKIKNNNKFNKLERYRLKSQAGRIEISQFFPHRQPAPSHSHHFLSPIFPWKESALKHTYTVKNQNGEIFLKKKKIFAFDRIYYRRKFNVELSEIDTRHLESNKNRSSQFNMDRKRELICGSYLDNSLA